MAADVSLAQLRREVDEELERWLAQSRDELASLEPSTGALVDEIVRVVRAGGQRLRPCFLYWGYRASGKPPAPGLVRAAAAMELLHTMALVHDDVMDGASERRGVAATHVLLGVPVAILVGDLAAVYADRLMLDGGLPADRLLAAQSRYHAMRVRMAAGQFLDVAGTATDPRRVASLKGGSYTVEGPLLLGSALAGAEPATETSLRSYGEALGRAFQLADDLRDGEAAGDVTPADVSALVDAAVAALDPEAVAPEASAVLREMASLVGDGVGA